MQVVIAILIVLIISLILGLLLAIADKYLAVKEDERIKVVRSMLPGINCGGCGFSGCDAMAKSLVEQTNKNISACRPIKKENKEKIIEYLKNTYDENGQNIEGLK